jgi:hypothetical protein
LTNLTLHWFWEDFTETFSKTFSSAHLAKFNRPESFCKMSNPSRHPYWIPEAEFLFIDGFQIFVQNHRRQVGISI